MQLSCLTEMAPGALRFAMGPADPCCEGSEPGACAAPGDGLGLDLPGCVCPPHPHHLMFPSSMEWNGMEWELFRYTPAALCAITAAASSVSCDEGGHRPCQSCAVCYDAPTHDASPLLPEPCECCTGMRHQQDGQHEQHLLMSRQLLHAMSHVHLAGLGHQRSRGPESP
jgi:hypothetical protein